MQLVVPCHLFMHTSIIINACMPSVKKIMQCGVRGHEPATLQGAVKLPKVESVKPCRVHGGCSGVTTCHDQTRENTSSSGSWQRSPPPPPPPPPRSTYSPITSVCSNEWYGTEVPPKVLLAPIGSWCKLLVEKTNDMVWSSTELIRGVGVTLGVNLCVNIRKCECMSMGVVITNCLQSPLHPNSSVLRTSHPIFTLG